MAAAFHRAAPASLMSGVRERLPRTLGDELEAFDRALNDRGG